MLLIMSLTLEWFLITSAYSLCDMTDDTYWTYESAKLFVINTCEKICLFVVESAWRAYRNSNAIPITAV